MVLFPSLLFWAVRCRKLINKLALILDQVLVNYARSSKEAEEVSQEVSLVISREHLSIKLVRDCSLRHL